jgi:hypothetical protein
LGDRCHDRSVSLKLPKLGLTVTKTYRLAFAEQAGGADYPAYG